MVINMNKTKSLTTSIGILLAISGSAFAHVDYSDLNAFSTQTNTFSRNGWFRGTDNPTNGCNLDATAQCLGDSHQLQFFKFTLDQDSNVSLTFTSNQNGLDPAFSLYKGLLPDEAHDDSSTDPLNAVDNNFEPAPHPTDSHYWDSNNIREGQFDALGNWSMANDDGSWSEIEYLIHKNDNSLSNAGAFETLNYFLKAGSYTIAAAGASTSSVNALLSGTMSFSPTPVPLPSAIWLMGSVLAGLITVGRRRNSN